MFRISPKQTLTYCVVRSGPGTSFPQIGIITKDAPVTADVSYEYGADVLPWYRLSNCSVAKLNGGAVYSGVCTIEEILEPKPPTETPTLDTIVKEVLESKEFADLLQRFVQQTLEDMGLTFSNVERSLIWFGTAQSSLWNMLLGRFPEDVEYAISCLEDEIERLKNLRG